MALCYNYIHMAAADTDAHLTPCHIVIYIFNYNKYAINLKRFLSAQSSTATSHTRFGVR